MVHPYLGILLRIKWNKLLKHTATWMNLKGIMLSEKKKTIGRGHKLYNSLYITFKKTKLEKWRTNYGCQWLGMIAGKRRVVTIKM